MLPSSRPQQHTHRTQFPSIIRTRSQLGHPLAPVDLYTSPLKKAIRDHSHSTDKTRDELKIKNMVLQDPISTDRDTHDGMVLSSSHKKRVSSPSFVRNDDAWKRTRVLAQSSKANSLSRRQSENYVGIPHRVSPVTPVKPSPAPSRVMSHESPGKGLIHMDLTRLPSISPLKSTGSLSKTFKITKDDGYMMKVPITPVRRQIVEGDVIPTDCPSDGYSQPRPCIRPSAAEEQVLHTHEPLPGADTIIVPSHKSSPLVESVKHQLPDHKHTIPCPQIQFRSTPVRSELLGTGLLIGEGSPLTPLTPPPHPNGSKLSREPSIFLNLSGQAPTSTARPAMPPMSPSIHQTSPYKPRIPLSSSSSLSRIPRQTSSSKLTPLVADPSSPTKALISSSPVKSKIRTKGNVNSGVRSRAPLTRLAAKRGLRRASSSLAGLSAGTASAETNVPLMSSDSAGTLNAAETCVRPPTERKSLVTSSLLASENASIQTSSSGRLHPSSNLVSPKKPTPLTALSTALQKLKATPPTAPLPRPRPNTSLGFSQPRLIPSQTPTTPAFTSQDDGHVGSKTPGSSAQSSAVLQVSKLLGHSQLNKTNSGVGRMGLPLRRPSTADPNGMSAPWAGAPFASKQTTLSTVPASPRRSAASTQADGSSTTRDPTAEVLDVDAWVPSDPDGNDKGKEKVERRTQEIEYFAPLSDEPRTRQQPSLELVSPSRRASQASMLLSQSLSLPREPILRLPARSASTSTAVQPIPRTPVKTRGRTRPPPPAPQPASERGAVAKPDDPMGGKRSNARMPGSLDVLKDCIIFVDVRTEEGEDAAALFVDMLRGLGARILAKPGKSCTHLVYKAGLPSTITKYKLLPEPRPLPVSIGWVVECVEKRAHVDESRFLVNLNEIGVAGSVQRRRSMQPKQMRPLTLGQADNGEPADISVRADSSFTSEEPSTSGLILATLNSPSRSPNDNLPPLARARQRRLRLPQE